MPNNDHPRRSLDGESLSGADTQSQKQQPQRPSTSTKRSSKSTKGASSGKRGSSSERRISAKKTSKATTSGIKVSISGKRASTFDKQAPSEKREPISSKVVSASHPNPNDLSKAPPKEPPKVMTKKKRPLQPIEVLLGEKVVNAAGTKISPTRFVTEGNVLGLYFAAKWCPPCRKLFPQLMLLYEEQKKAMQPKFEMIYVSFDHSVDSFNENMDKMPWWAVDYEDSDRREDLADKYNVKGIPVFLLIDASTLEVISRDGRVFLKIDPRGSRFPWKDLKPPSPSPPPAEAIAEALKVVVAAAQLLAAASTSAKSVIPSDSTADVVSIVDGGKTEDASKTDLSKKTA